MDGRYLDMQANGRPQRSYSMNRSADQAQIYWRTNWAQQQALGRSIDREMALRPDPYNKSLAVFPACDSTSGSSSTTAHHARGKHQDPDKKRYKSVPKVLKIFAERTSCVGPPYILTSKTWYATGIWSVLFLAAVGMTVYQLTENFTMFFLFAVKTTLSLDYRPLAFPMITICNTNPIKQSKIDLASPGLKDFLSLLDPAKFERKPPPQPTSPQSPPGGGPGKRRRKRFFDKEQLVTARGQNRSAVRPPGMNEKFLGGNEHPMTAMISDFKFLYGNEDSSTRMDMGHQIEDMLVSCSFEGRECDESDFTLVTTVEYGNCYIFNQKNVTGIFNSTNKLSKRPGSQHGLQLMLYLEVDEYVPGLTLGYGTRVSVSRPGTMAFPAIDGIFVSAGMETDVGTKMTEITRKGPPYGDCVSHDWFTTQYDYLYTRHACQETCVYRKILNICRCVLMSSEEYFPKNDAANYDACSSDAEYECASSVLYQVIEERNISCDCNNSCHDVIYDMQLSSRGWPVDSYLHMLIDGVCRTQKTDLDTHCNRLMDMLDLDIQTARRNFLKLNIFYRDLNYQKLTEEADYPISQFLSDLGGSIGLWVGLSVLSVAELIHLSFDLIKAFYGRCRYTGEMKNQRIKKKQNLTNMNNMNGHGKRSFHIAEPQLDYDQANRFWESPSAR